MQGSRFGGQCAGFRAQGCRFAKRMVGGRTNCAEPSLPKGSAVAKCGWLAACTESEFFIDNLLVRIHLIIEMILVDRPWAMGV